MMAFADRTVLMTQYTISVGLMEYPQNFSEYEVNGSRKLLGRVSINKLGDMGKQ